MPSIRRRNSHGAVCQVANFSTESDDEFDRRSLCNFMISIGRWNCPKVLTAMLVPPSDQNLTDEYDCQSLCNSRKQPYPVALKVNFLRCCLRSQLPTRILIEHGWGSRCV